MVPLFKVFMAADVLDRLKPVLFSGYVGEGPVSQQFEAAIGEFIGNPDVVVVNSGTAAITLALRLAGVGPDTSVVTMPMTCLATTMPILSLGAHPIWADIRRDGTIKPDDVRRKIREDTKAILCMDWGGLPCDLRSLRVLADKHKIALIEDACQAFGASYHGSPIGHQADFTCFSFQATKFLTTVDGGALAVRWNRAALERAKLLRWFGLDRTKGAMLRCGQDPPDWGYKFQTNDVQAAIGMANLVGLRDRLAIVRDNALFYQSAFRALTRVSIIEEGEGKESTFWAYTLLVDNVENFVRFMHSRGVMCSKIHDRNDTKTVFAKSRCGPLPGVDYFDSHHVCIPVGWWVSETDRQSIADAVCAWDQEARI